LVAANGVPVQQPGQPARLCDVIGAVHQDETPADPDAAHREPEVDQSASAVSGHHGWDFAVPKL
jgi:hypothetical protein